MVKLTSSGKFGFSRPDLDGNKLAKGMCLARKARDREMFREPHIITLLTCVILLKDTTINSLFIVALWNQGQPITQKVPVTSK